jgi:voltage-gated potassium channel
MKAAAAVQRFLSRAWVETALGGLILTSAALTVVEATSAVRHPIAGLSLDVITALFAVELAVRWKVSRSTKRFFREYWIDALSVLPLLVSVPFVMGSGAPRWFAPLALLRIFRLFRLVKIARNRALFFPSVLRRGAREVFFASGVVMLVVIFASTALVLLERDENKEFESFGQAFWFSIYSVVAAEPIPNPPSSLGGNIVSLFVILTGLFFFATVVGTVSALVTERMRSGDIIMDWEDLSDHLIVCGYSRKAEIIVREYILAFPDDDRPVVIVAEFDQLPQLRDPTSRSRVQFLNEDFTKLEALLKAGVKRAARCIVLSDTSKGRKERDADARTVLCALTVERLNPAIYTCAEIHRRENAHHLEMGKVNDFVVSGEHSAFLLAQSAVTRGVMSVFSELLTHERGNRFFRCHVPASWKSRSFLELLVHLKKEHDSLLVGVEREGHRIEVNPKEYVFRGGEDVVVIGSDEVTL